MHELGHNLCLDHGGNDHIPNKPNYRSIMNSHYLNVGKDINCDYVGDGVIDFSDELLNDVIESCLDEIHGVCNNVSIDYNHDFQYGPCIQWDLNFDGDTTDLMHGYNDWVNLRLRQNCSGAAQSEDVHCEF